MNDNDLTTGSIKRTLIMFALPYLFSSFMQTFYGLADMYVVGVYNDKVTSNAVSNGSQITHMLTVIIVGIAMGTTVKIGTEIGQKDRKAVSKTIGNSICLFTVLAIIFTVLLLIKTDDIINIMHIQKRAISQTRQYLLICFAGTPFIIAYNVISSIFRGMGDTKRPMCFVAVACAINVVLDFVFVGVMGLGARGAALGTVCGQAGSVIISFIAIIKMDLGISIKKEDIGFEIAGIHKILRVGIPIALQDGLIQVAFITITIIANSMGLVTSTSVGIVEKIIGFLFLVPSAFLAAISTMTAQNVGAGKDERAKQALKYGIKVTVIWGLICGIYCNIAPASLVAIFTNDIEVIKSGCAYLRSYSFDTMLAAIHFCFSGYFCGCQKSYLSFVHNITSIIVARIPGAYLASIYFPGHLIIMGMAAPAGSALSAIMCFGFYVWMEKHEIKN